MGGWWTEIDDDVLGVLTAHSAMTPAELGLKLGMSEAATISVVSMLAQEGKVRICLVELPR